MNKLTGLGIEFVKDVFDTGDNGKPFYYAKKGQFGHCCTKRKDGDYMVRTEFGAIQFQASKEEFKVIE